MTSPDHSEKIAIQLQKIQSEYESIKVNRIEQLTALYAEDAIFKDPFKEVVGKEAIAEIFSNMFNQLNNPSFKVLSILHKQNEASLLWDFSFGFKRWNKSPQSLRGVSWLVFDEAGLIASHTDYWDAADGIYEKLPLAGSLIRLMKSQV
jgi:steroid delta-isomerase